MVESFTQSPHRSLVLGATGHVGREVVRELLARPRPGSRVVAHARPDSPRLEGLEPGWRAAGAEVLTCPFEGPQLAEALAELRPTHVFLCYGTTARRARREGVRGDPYVAVDLALTQAGIAATQPLEPAPRLVYLSSIGASPRARGAYLRSRWSAEDMVRTSGLPWTICRAPLVSARGRDEARPAEALAAPVLRLVAGALRLVGLAQRAERLRPTSAPELAHGLVHAGHNYTTIGRVLEAEELRFRTAIHRADPLPATRRDDARH